MCRKRTIELPRTRNGVIVSKEENYGCTDYRQEMILAGLRMRLQKEDLSKEERDAIFKEIRGLEAAMALD